MHQESPVSASNSKTPTSPDLLSAAATAAAPPITPVVSSHSSDSSSASAITNGLLVLGECEEYTRLKAAAADIVKLIPDVEKRMKMLNQIDVPYFETSHSTEATGSGRLLELSLYKVLKNEEVLVAGDRIRFIGLDLLVDKSVPEKKFVSIEGITERLEQRAQDIRAQQIIEWKLPDDNASYYVHRKSYEKKIVDYFGMDESVHHTMVVNAGLGGVGKTQLAINYVHYNEKKDAHYEKKEDAHYEKKKYQFKLWFNASTREQLLLKYCAFALEKELVLRDAKPEEMISAVCDWLTKHTGWLIVFDNAADETMLKEFLPSSGGDILITTRWQEWAEKYKKIDIGVMTEHEPVELLKRSIDPDGHRKFTEAEDIDLNSLAKKLGFLPLALAQAGAYIKSFKGHINIAEYEKLFKKFKALLLADKRLPEDKDQKPVAVTWHITLEALKEECPKAIQLLEALSFLDPTSIPNFLIEKYSEQQGATPWTDAEREAAVRISVSYSLLQQSTDDQVCNIHTLVQSVIVAGLSINQQQNCLMQWMTGINQLHDDSDKNPPLFVEQRENQLLAHSNSIRDYIKKEHFFDNKLEKAEFYHHIAGIYFKLGYPQKQKELLEEALNILTDHHGRRHGQITLTLANLATAYGNLGEDKKQKDLLEEALRLQIDYYGQGHWQTAITLNNLATAYSDLGDNQKQKELLEEALEIYVAHYGRAHWMTAGTLNNLANAYGALGDNQKKKDLLEDVLGIFVAHYGRNHWQTAMALGNLASTYGALGDNQKKKDLLEEVLGIQTAHYGRSHWQIATTLANLANAYSELGDQKKKKEFLEEVLVIQVNHYGRKHWQTAKTLANLANAYSELGNIKKKKELLKEALSINVAHYGREHRETAYILENLANAYGALGDNQKKKDLLEEALGIFVAHYGRSHWQTAITLNNLANAYGALGDNQKKKDLLEDALVIETAHYGRNHWQTAITLGNLASTYGALGDNQKKKNLLEEGLGIFVAHYGRNHWQTAMTLHNLANAYGALGDNQKEKDLLEEALVIKTAHYGRDHWEAGKTVFNLAIAHVKLGELKLAYKTMEYAYRCLLSHPLHSAYPHAQQAKQFLAQKKPLIANQIESHNSSASKPNQPRLLTPSSTAKMSIHSAERQLLLGQLVQKNAEAVRRYKATDYTQALVLWQNTLEIAQRIPKEDYPNFHDEVATLNANIGKAHKHLGHHEEAIRFFKQSIAIYEEKYGINCKEAQKSRDKLAEVVGLFSMVSQRKSSVISSSLEINKQVSIQSIYSLSKNDSNTFVAIRTLGDGNCAYNAFALGLCDIIEQGELQVLPEEFLSRLTIDLNLISAAAGSFKDWLALNTDNEQRQKRLAPILRAYAVDTILYDYDAQYKENYEERLINAYEMFLIKDYDDTFYPHQSIKQQFEGVKELNLPEERYKDFLRDWWRASGKENYFNHVRNLDKGIDITRWGSEVELDVLASCFGINVYWAKSLQLNAGQQQLGIGGGLIAGLAPSQIRHLTNLGIGAAYKGTFRLHSFANQQQLIARLNPLQQKDIILSILSEIKEGDTAFPNNIVGIENNLELRQELIERNVITRRDNTYFFITNDDKHIARSSIEERVNGLDDEPLKNRILDSFRANSPTFNVLHQGGHWSYCQHLSSLSSLNQPTENLLISNQPKGDSIMKNIKKEPQISANRAKSPALPDSLSAAAAAAAPVSLDTEAVSSAGSQAAAPPPLLSPVAAASPSAALPLAPSTLQALITIQENNLPFRNYQTLTEYFLSQPHDAAIIESELITAHIPKEVNCRNDAILDFAHLMHCSEKIASTAFNKIYKLIKDDTTYNCFEVLGAVIIACDALQAQSHTRPDNVDLIELLLLLTKEVIKKNVDLTSKPHNNFVVRALAATNAVLNLLIIRGLDNPSGYEAIGENPHRELSQFFSELKTNLDQSKAQHPWPYFLCCRAQQSLNAVESLRTEMQKKKGQKDAAKEAVKVLTSTVGGLFAFAGGGAALGGAIAGTVIGFGIPAPTIIPAAIAFGAGCFAAGKQGSDAVEHSRAIYKNLKGEAVSSLNGFQRTTRTSGSTIVLDWNDNKVRVLPEAILKTLGEQKLTGPIKKWSDIDKMAIVYYFTEVLTQTNAPQAFLEQIRSLFAEIYKNTKSSDSHVHTFILDSFQRFHQSPHNQVVFLALELDNYSQDLVAGSKDKSRAKRKQRLSNNIQLVHESIKYRPVTVTSLSEHQLVQNDWFCWFKNDETLYQLHKYIMKLNSQLKEDEAAEKFISFYNGLNKLALFLALDIPQMTSEWGKVFHRYILTTFPQLNLTDLERKEVDSVIQGRAKWNIGKSGTFIAGDLIERIGISGTAADIDFLFPNRADLAMCLEKTSIGQTNSESSDKEKNATEAFKKELMQYVDLTLDGKLIAGSYKLSKALELVQKEIAAEKVKNKQPQAQQRPFWRLSEIKMGATPELKASFEKLKKINYTFTVTLISGLVSENGKSMICVEAFTPNDESDPKIKKNLRVLKDDIKDVLEEGGFLEKDLKFSEAEPGSRKINISAESSILQLVHALLCDISNRTYNEVIEEASSSNAHYGCVMS